MTLVISVTSPYGSWLAADRRYGPPADRSFLATKICRLDTTNSWGHICYFGIGAYVKSAGMPFELSTWVSNTLRGVKRSHEQSMAELLVSAKKRKIGSAKLNIPHLFQWAGYVDGVPTLDSLGTHVWMQETNLKTKQLSLNDIGAEQYGFERRQSRDTLLSRGGSGAGRLSNSEVNKLIKLAKRAGRSAEHAERVGAYLAFLVRSASQKEGNKSVSPECLVSVLLPDGGGWHREYDSDGRSSSSEIIPSVSSGFPVGDLIREIMSAFSNHAADVRTAWKEELEPPEMEDGALDEALKRVSDKPDNRI